MNSDLGFLNLVLIPPHSLHIPKDSVMSNPESVGQACDGVTAYDRTASLPIKMHSFFFCSLSYLSFYDGNVINTDVKSKRFDVCRSGLIRTGLI